MVTKLLSAQSEIKACKDAAAAKTKDLAVMESQVSKGRVQLQAALLDVAQLQSSISAMVPRSELEAARQHFEEVNATLRAEEHAQRDLVRSLNDRLRALEEEKSQLHSKMQVQQCPALFALTV
jgi:predicted  nucleic acid-binding Zn-ribbon protein